MALLVSLLSLTGCASGRPEVPAVGRYGMAAVAGEPIPTRIEPRDDCERVATGGALEILPQNRFRLSLSVHSSCPSQSMADLLTYDGEFDRNGDSLVFTPERGLAPFVAFVRGDSIIAEIDRLPALFRWGARGEADITEFYEAEIRELIEQQLRDVRAANDAYDCRHDPILDGVPPLLAADTAGLGGLIAESFPEWRLSSEREIACRFPLLDGSRPEMYWGERWGSGRAWWIWEGDFDGDGRMDRLVLLTSRVDPGEDLLAVFLGNGAVSSLCGPGGWGVAVGPSTGRAAEAVANQGSVEALADAITVIYWDKGADTYVWDGEGFS